jgi:hypothetical protein
MANVADQLCPKCNGQMWDNRSSKRNPKAPDYKCKNKDCDGAVWLDQGKTGTAAVAVPTASQPANGATAPSAPRGNEGRELITGAFRDAERATEALRRAAELAHLVSPQPMCATLPDGCELMVAAVMVAELPGNYIISGDREHPADSDVVGLGKVALDMISAAAGVDWLGSESRRLDDGSDPYLYEYRAVGRVRNLDGTWRMLPAGEKTMDLRPGSPQCELIEGRERKKAEDYKQKGWTYKGDFGATEIRQMRAFIDGHAITKARLRTIAALGLARSYKRSELRKPYVCARLAFTGLTDNPESKRYFDKRIADSFLGATDAMYGPELSPAAVTTRAPVQRLCAPGEMREMDHNDAPAVETTATHVETATRVEPEASKVASGEVSERTQSTSDPAAPLRPRIEQLLKTDAGKAAFDKLFGDTVLPEEINLNQIAQLLDLVATGEAMNGATTAAKGAQAEMKL